MFFSSRKTKSTSRKRTKHASRQETRRIRLEALEPRRLLSGIGLNVLSNVYTGANASSGVTLQAGTSVLLALNTSDSGQTVKFGVATSGLLTQSGQSSATVAPTAALMPSTNKTLQLTLQNLGTVNFQLFDNLTPNTASHVEALVNSSAGGGLYKGDQIYRAESGFVLQGGNEKIVNGQYTGQQINTPPSGIPTTIPEEFSPDLMYTSPGTLALARQNTPNTSGSDFFITESSYDTTNTLPALNYSYTLFGFQTTNPTVSGSSNTVDQALQAEPVTPNGTPPNQINYLTNPVTITSAGIITDTQNGVLMLKAPSNVTGSFTVTVTAADGTNTPVTQTFTVNVVANTISSNTVTDPWAAHTPSAPTGLTFQPQSGQGTTTLTDANNSASTKQLQFLVNGTTLGDQVTVYADGVALGSPVVASTGSTLVATGGSALLADGTHTFTAIETAVGSTENGVSASWTDSGGNTRSATEPVLGFSSPSTSLTIFSSLAVTNTPPRLPRRERHIRIRSRLTRHRATPSPSPPAACPRA